MRFERLASILNYQFDSFLEMSFVLLERFEMKYCGATSKIAERRL